MAIRVLVYMEQGDGAGASASSQIRAIINEMRVDAQVQIITDKMQHQMSGIEDMPVVMIDGLKISQGNVPSRMEIQRALQQRLDQLEASRVTEEM